MAILKLSFGLTVLSVAVFLCLNMSTEARVVKNEEEKVNPGQLVDMNNLSIIVPPDTNTVPTETTHNPAKTTQLSDQARDTMAFNATTLSAPSLAVRKPKNWCIAKPSTPDTQLDKNVQFACTQGYTPFDCSIIQVSGTCYNPANSVSAASVVMNLFFQAQGQMQSACYFNGSGLIIHDNPSIGSCIYPPK